MTLTSVPGGWVDVNLLPPFQLIDQGDVDDEPWYVIQTYRSDVAAWLRSQSRVQVYEHDRDTVRFGIIFDVHQKVYTMLCLKWR